LQQLNLSFCCNLGMDDLHRHHCVPTLPRLSLSVGT
jgi:hypothetical protein